MLRQSAERRCRELEAGDVASVARLVRGPERVGRCVCLVIVTIACLVMAMALSGECGSWIAASSCGMYYSRLCIACSIASVTVTAYDHARG